MGYYTFVWVTVTLCCVLYFPSGTAISPVGSLDMEDISRPSSPEESALNFWNPMMEDYTSSRNTYRIDTNDLDIAIHGFSKL
jgi:hypothetical protein